jgi:hypothetical protein
MTRCPQGTIKFHSVSSASRAPLECAQNEADLVHDGIEASSSVADRNAAESTASARPLKDGNCWQKRSGRPNAKCQSAVLAPR